MADKAVGHVSSSIFEDAVKSGLSGSLVFDAATLATGAHKWAYVRKVMEANANIFDTTEDYMNDGVALAAGDICKYVAIKHSGTSDGTNTTSSGLMISLAGAATHNDADGIFLEPGEMIVLKLPFTTIDNLHAVAVTITNGKPSADAGAVQVIAAGLLDDVA